MSSASLGGGGGGPLVLLHLLQELVLPAVKGLGVAAPGVGVTGSSGVDDPALGVLKKEKVI